MVCACLEEARSKRSRVRLLEGLIMCSSRSPKGCYGCEAWINLTTVIGSYNCKKCRVSEDDASIIHAEPRSIIVSIRIGPFALSAFGAHAPHHSSPQFSAWWDSFPTLWHNAKRANHKVVCRLWQTFCREVVLAFGSEYIGAVGATHRTTCSTTGAFNELGDVVAITLSSSMDTCCRSRCTIDYIGFHGARKVLVGVPSHIVVLYERSLPIDPTFSIVPSSGHCRYGGRALPYDSKLIGTPSQDQRKSEACIPAIPCEVEPTSHCHLIETALVDALAVSYPKLSSC